jgi:hypothetical protein
MNNHQPISIASSNSSSATPVESEEDENAQLQRPVLPWLNQTNNSSLSTLHTMKQQVKAEQEIKVYKRWTWAKIWLVFMNSVVKYSGLIMKEERNERLIYIY